MEPAEYALMDAVEDHLWWYRALHTRIVAALAPVRGTVLDAGCGTGGLLARLARARPDLALIGLEWDGAAAARARAKSGVPTARGDVAAIPFAPGTFDAVIAADVLCHEAVAPSRALPAMARVLRPGGLLVVNMPAYAWLASAHDIRVRNARRRSAGQVAAMLRDAGFGAVRARYWNSLLFPLMVAQRKLLARRAGAASDVAPLPPWLNAALHGVTALERALPLRYPAGGSVLATARRR